MRNGLWTINRTVLEIEHLVLQTGNTITVECTPVRTTANQIIIRYVNAANTTQILQTVSPNPAPQQKGSTYVFTVPETLNITSGTYTGNWSVVTGTTQSVLIADSTATQYINVLYSSGLKMYDVTINYVEQGNTGHLLQGVDGLNNPITNPIVVGQRQVNSIHSFTAPATIDDNGVLWQIVGSTSRVEQIGATNYQLIVEYEPVLSSSHVLIKYVDQDTSNIIETFDVGYKQVGALYSYQVPATHINAGLWNIVGNSGTRTHTVLDSANEIIVYFTKATSNLKVNFVEDGNETNIINSHDPINLTPQINTIYTYSAPAEYIDAVGGKWTVVPNTNRITIQSGNNVLNVKYTKKLPLSNLEIRYIEKNNPSNILETINIEKPQIGTTYNHSAPQFINSSGLWTIDGSTSRNYSITESSSVFTIEYTKVMTSIIIEYYDYDTDTVINTINVQGTYQVGTSYNYTVPSIYNSAWELQSGGTYRLHPIVPGINTIRVPYVNQLSTTRDVTIKYVERNNWSNVLAEVPVGTMNIGDDVELIVVQNIGNAGVITPGTPVEVTIPDVLSHNGNWSLYGVNVSALYKITADNYEIYVEYEKVMSSGNITINYVEQGNPTNILDTVIVGNKQVGSNYIYSPPSLINVNGEWVRVGNGNISHTVLATRKCYNNSISEKLISYKSNY